MNTHLQETLRGVEVIQAFKRESRFVARFRRVLQRVLQAANRSTIYSSFYPPMTAMLTYTTIAFLLWAGTRDTWSALGTFGMPDISIGTLTAFALLLQRFFTPVTALGDEWQTVQGALSGAERIFEVLDAARRRPAATVLRKDSSRDGLVFEDVVFGYVPGTPILHAVSLHVAPGEHVALVGRTGAGKTSIVHLLAGLTSRGKARFASPDATRAPCPTREAISLRHRAQASQLFQRHGAGESHAQ